MKSNSSYRSIVSGLTLSIGLIILCSIVGRSVTCRVFASENVAHRPFAMWADVPEKNQFVAGFVYEESEAYHIWASGKYHNVTVISGGEQPGLCGHAIRHHRKVG